MNVIETSALTKRYGDVLAVDAMSFSVEQGRMFGFLGRTSRTGRAGL